MREETGRQNMVTGHSAIDPSLCENSNLKDFFDSYQDIQASFSRELEMRY